MPYKSTRFPHLQGLNFMSKNAYLADLVTIIGTQDLVFVKSTGNNMSIGNILKICLNSLIINFMILEDINLVILVFMKSICNNMPIGNILKICLNSVNMKNKNYNYHSMICEDILIFYINLVRLIFVENQNLAIMKVKDKKYINYIISQLWKGIL